MRRIMFATVLATITAVGLTSCAAPAVQLQADYLGYDTVTLPREAALVVEGTVLSSEYTVGYSTFDGDNPQDNPYFGMPENEVQKAIEEAGGVPTTLVTIRVDAVHKGPVSPGTPISVIQTGGVMDGVRYELVAEPPLETGGRYLLFLADSGDGVYGILGGSAGAYQAVDSPRTRTSTISYSAVNPDLAPFDRLTPAEVDQLV